MSTNVPAPQFTPTGFVAPTDSEILAGVQADINIAFGGNLNFTTQAGSQTNPTPQGQLAASFAAIISQADQTFQFYTTQLDPAYAEGRMQDAIGRIYFMERIGATSTVLNVLCIGAINTILPIGSQIVDGAGNLYSTTIVNVIGIGGSVTAQFSANVPGAITVPTSISIYQAIPGWDTVTLISGVPGINTELRSAFETRRALSTAANSIGSSPSILGAVLGVPGVTQAYVTENTENFPTTKGGVTLAANSVYVAAAGGTPAAVAQAIWTRKGPGCAYGAGNTTVQVLDTSAEYSPPFPSYEVTYQIPNPLPLLFSVQMVNSSQVPSTATAQIQQAIINAAAGLPNANNVVDGPAAGIGALIYASRYVPSIASLGMWAEGQIIRVQIGSNNNPDAALAYGSSSGTNLTVTALSIGTITVGDYVSISNGSGTIIPGTTIVAQVSGTVGATGVYTISSPQTIAGLAAGGTTLLGFATADQNSVQANINQIPSVSAANISVTFQ